MCRASTSVTSPSSTYMIVPVWGWGYCVRVGVLCAGGGAV